MGKIVVKNVQSQNSAVSFKLPSTDGSANQVMKTDGSANLGFKDANDSFPSTNASKTYTLPNTDGSSGQELQIAVQQLLVHHLPLLCQLLMEIIKDLDFVINILRLQIRQLTALP